MLNFDSMPLPRYCLDSSAASVIDLKHRCFIPFDVGNSDFRKVLAWVNEGNALGPFNQEVLAELNKEQPATGIQKSGRSRDDVEGYSSPSTVFF